MGAQESTNVLLGFNIANVEDVAFRQPIARAYAAKGVRIRKRSEDGVDSRTNDTDSRAGEKKTTPQVGSGLP